MNRNRVVGFLRTWYRATPLFMGAALFLSAFFAFLSPLPVLLAAFQFGALWAAVSLAANSAIIYFAGQPSLAYLFLALTLPLLLVVPTMLVRPSGTIERTTVVAWLAQLVFVFGGIYVFSRVQGIHVGQEIRDALDQFAKLFSEGQGQKNLMNADEIAEWKKATWESLPSSFGTAALLSVWATIHFVVQFNPKGRMSAVGKTRETLQAWKLNDYVIWPALVLWGIVLFAEGKTYVIALNGLKILLAFFAIQGVAVLSSLFDRFRLFGFFRSLVFLLVIFFMMPLLLSVGFFDQWFDFRAKFRQSNSKL